MLKYHLYNKSDIVAMCYNKYMVREYVENKGLAHILNKLYFVSERIEDIPWSGLPEECVLNCLMVIMGMFSRERMLLLILKRRRRY